MNLMKQQTKALQNLGNNMLPNTGIFDPGSAINARLPSAGSMFASSTPSLNLGFTSDLVNRASLAVAPNMFTQAGQSAAALGAFNTTNQMWDW